MTKFNDATNEFTTQITICVGNKPNKTNVVFEDNSSIEYVFEKVLDNYLFVYLIGRPNKEIV